MTASISPRQLAEIHSSGREVKLIDVRTPAEFREVHVEFARNVPLDRLNAAELGAEFQGEPLYVICRSGNRAGQACEKLAAAGLEAVNIEGGTTAWGAAGLPVVRGQKSVSLERQVRIAAGSLVLAGAVLALTIHPYFAALPALIGAGLMFSGITDTCGMAMVLAKMPWNQAGSAAANGTACNVQFRRS